jgi:hypothetical protein
MVAINGETGAKLRSREEEIQILKGDIEHVKLLNSKEVEDSHEFQSEIEALNRHMGLMNQQNFEVRKILVNAISSRKSWRSSLKPTRWCEGH